jgi:large subunit ribosomal protein L4
MEVKVVNISGKETGAKVQLPDAIFAVTPNDHAIYLDVKQYLANQRQGTHKAKQRNKIAGSTRKLYKQKGTGGSRKGSIKNPLYRGGGRIFGPEPRDYSFKLNKKLKRLARRSALAYKTQNNAFTVVEGMNFEMPKTKEFLTFLSSFSAKDKKILLVVQETHSNAFLSARNLPGANVISAAELNTYEIMDAERVFVEEQSIPVLEKLLSA